MLEPDRVSFAARNQRLALSDPGMPSLPGAMSRPEKILRRIARRDSPIPFPPRRAPAKSWQSDRIANAQACGPLALLCDGAAIVAASLVSGFGFSLLSPGYRENAYSLMGAGVLAALSFSGLQRSKAMRAPLSASTASERAQDGFLSWAAAFAPFLFIIFTMKLSPGLTSGGLLTFFLIGAVAVVASRIGAPILLARFFEKSALDGQHVIVIGPRGSSALTHLTGELRRTSGQEPLPIVFDEACSDEAWPREESKALGYARRLAHDAKPGKILVISRGVPAARLESLLSGLAALPRAVCVVPDETTANLLRYRQTAIGANVAVEVQSTHLNLLERSLKRVFDIIVASCLLVVSAPILLTIAAIIKLDSSGPVLFRQIRTGYRGQTFKIFKFRTMRVMENGPNLVQARKDDARVTRIGRLLRRSSLDEMPQLINVLVGDMSLVGPRPHAIAHDTSYALEIPDYTLRQHVLPGITGWAQVNGFRGETSAMDAMRGRIEHDIWYAKHCSLGLDIRIMARTLFEIMRARNAY